MLKRTLKSSIIVLIQLVLPGILIMISALWLLNNTHFLTHWQRFFEDWQVVFLLWHVLCYLALFLLWPHLVSRAIERQNEPPTFTQIAKAKEMRFYLIGLLVVFELLTLLR